jgi:peptidoglycan/LPS O-acetylase OafA/YrhL
LFRYRAAKVLLGFAPACVLAMIAVELSLGSSPLVENIFYFLTPFRFASFGLGMTWAIYEGTIARQPRLARRISLALIAVGIASLYFTPGLLCTAKALGRSLFAGGIILGLLGLSVDSPWPARYLNLAPLRYVGKISYGLYLFHLPIYFSMGVAIPWSMLPGTDMGTPSPLRWALAVALLFTVATLSFYLFEQPIRRLGTRRMRPRPVG